MSVSAVLLNTSVFFAENNVRRSVATISGNYPVSVKGEATTHSLTLAPGRSWTTAARPGESYDTPPAVPSIFILSTTGPLKVDLWMPPITDVRGAIMQTHYVTRLLVLDDGPLQAAFTNLSTSAVTLTLIEG